MDPICPRCGTPVDRDYPFRLVMAGLSDSGRDEYQHMHCATPLAELVKRVGRSIDACECDACEHGTHLVDEVEW